MLAKVKRTVSLYKMLSNEDKVLVGLSGGPDSVCLLHILRQFPVKLYIAHLNHGLRGEEADKDQEFCLELGKRLGIPVFTKKVRIKRSEDSARKARYKFLEETAHKIGANRIALGHNADDQVETVLMRLLRGTGVKGLAGIPPVRKHGDLLIIRPLINVWREEILNYLKKRSISYRIDSSNLKTDFFRNRIRHRLIPYLKRYNPNIKGVLLNLGNNMAMLNEDFNTFMEQEIVKRYMDRIGMGLSARHIDEIMNLMRTRQGTKILNLPKGIKVVREYDRLIFCKDKDVKKNFEIQLPIPGKVKIPGSNIFITSRLCKLPKKIERNLFEVMLDYDRIKGLLKIRNRRPGDVFHPIGLNGKKKVKDIFIELKIPQRLRDKIPLVVSGSEICWIPGYRIGERFKITPETKQVVKINVEGVKDLWQS